LRQRARRRRRRRRRLVGDLPFDPLHRLGEGARRDPIGGSHDFGSHEEEVLKHMGEAHGARAFCGDVHPVEDPGPDAAPGSGIRVAQSGLPPMGTSGGRVPEPGRSRRAYPNPILKEVPDQPAAVGFQFRSISLKGPKENQSWPAAT
jgi:hypothetical protein